MQTRIKRWSIAITTLLLLTVAVQGALAAPPERTVRIGILTSTTEERGAKLERSLVDGLRDRGYVEGKNLVIVRRTGRYPGLDPYAKELGEMKLDAIVTSCGYSTALAVKATKTTPIVMGSVTDPVGYGFVKSLAHPGTNVTGTSASIPGLAPKMLEYLHLALPSVRRVGVLVNAKNPAQQAPMRDAEAAAQSLGIALIAIDVRQLSTDAAAHEVIRQAGANALMALPDDDLFRMFLPSIYAASEALRIPTFFNKSDSVGSGGTLSYGPDSFEAFRRSAEYVNKVANGTSPAELPVEQPMKMEFVINMKRAATFGLTIPRAALLRADWVVQ